MADDRTTTKSPARKTAGTVAAATMAAASLTAMAPGDLTIFNPYTTPVVYDNVGHVLGGGERRVVPPLDSMGCYVLGWGWIIVKKGTPVCPPPAPAEAEQEGDGATEAAPVQSDEQEKSGESVPA